VVLTKSEKDISPFPQDRFECGWVYLLSRLGVHPRRDIVMIDEVVGGSRGSGGGVPMDPKVNCPPL